MVVVSVISGEASTETSPTRGGATLRGGTCLKGPCGSDRSAAGTMVLASYAVAAFHSKTFCRGTAADCRRRQSADLSAKETRAASDVRLDEQNLSSDQEYLTGEEQNPPDTHTRVTSYQWGERGLGGPNGSAALRRLLMKHFLSVGQTPSPMEINGTHNQ